MTDHYDHRHMPLRGKTMLFNQTKLKNGIRVVTAAMPHVESVSFGIFIGAGSRHESAQRNGMSHFLEHMLFKGTRKRSASDISRAIEGRGGYLNAFTQTDSTCYFAQVAHEYLWQGLDVLTDMYLNSRMESAEIKKEAGVIVEEIMMYRDRPQHRVHELFEETVWVDHPVGRPIAGNPDTVLSFRRQDLMAYKKAAYVPGNTIFAFAGKVDHERCVAKVAALTGKLKNSRKLAARPVKSATKRRSVLVEARDVEQSHVVIGTRLFGRNDPRRFALKVLSVVLGENMSSRLFQEVREKHGLAYYVHSSISLLDDTGTLAISAGLDKTRSDKAVSLILKELARLKKTPVGAGEMKRAKEYATGQLRLGLERTMNQMMWIAENAMFRQRVPDPADIVSSVKAVTADDVQRLASKILRGSKMNLAMIGPGLGREDASRFRKQLAAL